MLPTWWQSRLKLTSFPTNYLPDYLNPVAQMIGNLGILFWIGIFFFLENRKENRNFLCSCYFLVEVSDFVNFLKTISFRGTHFSVFIERDLLVFSCRLRSHSSSEFTPLKFSSSWTSCEGFQLKSQVLKSTQECNIRLMMFQVSWNITWSSLSRLAWRCMLHAMWHEHHAYHIGKTLGVSRLQCLQISNSFYLYIYIVWENSSISDKIVF